MNVDETIEELRRRLDRYVPERYPVQHATTQFHLGQALLHAEQSSEALQALRASLRWFPAPMVTERAKVLNLAGAALRAEGEHAAATEAFTWAARVFAEQGLSAEHGAAMFNLALVQRDAGDHRSAAEGFARAREQLAAGAVGPQAAAALQQGSALLEAGDVDGAVAALHDAVALAERGAEREMLGTAANALGLALMAAGRTADAVDAFGLAVAAHPRSVRAAEFAMAKANLALAYEDAGDASRARFEARHALGVAGAAAPVRSQAQAIIDRTEPTDGSLLLAVLDGTAQDGWMATVREEVARWAAVPPAERRADVALWVQGQAQREGDATAVHHLVLGALLELPPADLDAVVAAIVEAVGDLAPDDADRVRSALVRGMALFPVPQLLRLRDRFNGVSAELDQEASWS